MGVRLTVRLSRRPGEAGGGQYERAAVSPPKLSTDDVDIFSFNVDVKMRQKQVFYVIMLFRGMTLNF